MNCLSRVFILLCGAFCLMPAQVSASDIEVKEKQDSVTQLSEIAVIAKAKQKNDLRLEPLSATVIKLGEIERKQIVGLSDLSYQTPNLYIPDYGSKMTSSIYVRGLGSRIDNPAVGLYVDNVPLLNKNGYDFDMWDIMRMEVLRGPQSTLYGRNTVGGIINIYTLSPNVYQGFRLSGSYSTGNSYNIKGSYYGRITKKLAFSLGGNYFSSDGFFKNEFDGSKCDWIKGGTGRFRLVYSPNSRLTVDNSLMFTYVEQGGYAYRLYDSSTGIVNPVNYNDKSGYDRVTVSNGLSVNYNADNYVFSSVTSWQYLDDCMILDQDFTPKDMFTLKQAQHEHTVTQDFVFKSKEGRRYQWLTGATFFYKGMDMDAPVVFKQDGIKQFVSLLTDTSYNGSVLEMHEVAPIVSMFVFYFWYQYRIKNYSLKKTVFKELVCFGIIFFSMKRIVFLSTFITLCLFEFIRFFYKRRKNVYTLPIRFVISLLGWVMLLVMFIFVLFIKSGLLYDFLSYFNINSMARAEFWQGISGQYEFSPFYLGRGLGYVSKWMDNNWMNLGIAGLTE
ncbi:MAG: TonB-dependent receptor plug domain-containing protein, partial [Bacteroidales bacterium]|nr:TonB-dependent receptor plug domain-containing protein [Bacteroidales bacterium]